MGNSNEWERGSSAVFDDMRSNVEFKQYLEWDDEKPALLRIYKLNNDWWGNIRWDSGHCPPFWRILVFKGERTYEPEREWSSKKELAFYNQKKIEWVHHYFCIFLLSV